MMNTQKITKISSQLYIGFSVLSLGYVSLLSIYSPQATMNLVSTQLPNTDAISSIRGIYGGAGLVITITLIYLLLNNIKQGLVFLAMFWSAYASSRLITVLVDGPLGKFGTQWLIIETIFSIFALILLWLNKKPLEKKS